MKETNENQYVKRTQKDYSYAFKLGIVQEVGNGELDIKAAARKYGNFDWINKSTQKMAKSKDQKLFELEQKVLLLEKQKKELEKKVEQADKKAIFFRYDDRYG